MSRYRYRRGMTTGQKAGTCAAAGVALAILTGAHHVHGHHTPASTSAASLTVASHAGMTPASWARDFLRSARLPVTSCNLAAVTAWERAEGGNWANSARANPLNSTMPEPGSSAINSAGVQAYTGWRAGMRATVATLRNGRYPGILAAFRSGHSAQAVADAVGASPWGTGYYQASC